MEKEKIKKEKIEDQVKELTISLVKLIDQIDKEVLSSKIKKTI